MCFNVLFALIELFVACLVDRSEIDMNIFLR